MTIFNDEPKEITLATINSCEGCENLSTYICDGCSRNPSEQNNLPRFNGELMNLILDKSYLESAISFLEYSSDIILLLPKRFVKGTSCYQN